MAYRVDKANLGQTGETDTFNAKLVDPAYAVDVGAWFSGKYHVPYSVSLLEVE